MNEDIVKRLEQIENDIEYSDVAHTCGKAVDEIKRLHAEVERLKREKADADSIGYTDGLHDGAQQGFQQAIAETGERLDVVNRLRAEVERLRKELTDIANTFDESWTPGSVERSAGDRARAALAETGTKEMAASFAYDKAMKELDGLRDWSEARASVLEELAMASSRADAAERKVEKLREALKPFADEADLYEPDDGDGIQIAWASEIGSLRRARAILAETENKGGKE